MVPSSEYPSITRMCKSGYRFTILFIRMLILSFSLSVGMMTSGFDIIYALQDDDFDKEHKLFSVPAWLGKKGALIFSAVVHFFAGGLIVFVGFLANFGVWYWVGAVIFILLLIYQHTLVKPNDLSRVNLAFFTTNGIASVIFACFTVFSLFF